MRRQQSWAVNSGRGLRVQAFSLSWVVLWVEFCPYKKDLWEFTLSISECDLFSQQGLYIGQQVNVSSLGCTLIQYDWHPHKSGEIWTQTQTCVGEDDIKRHREVAMYKPRREAWNRFSLIVLRGNQSCQHLSFRILASRTARQYICC